MSMQLFFLQSHWTLLPSCFFPSSSLPIHLLLPRPKSHLIPPPSSDYPGSCWGARGGSSNGSNGGSKGNPLPLEFPAETLLQSRFPGIFYPLLLLSTSLILAPLSPSLAAFFFHLKAASEHLLRRRHLFLFSRDAKEYVK